MTDYRGVYCAILQPVPTGGGKMEWEEGLVLVREYPTQGRGFPTIDTEEPPFTRGFQIDGLVCADCFRREYGVGVGDEDDQ